MSSKFYAGNKPRRFNDRKMLVKSRKNRPVMKRFSSNTRIQGEKVQTFRVYVGSLGAEGLHIPVGPASDYSTTQYFMFSRNYNNYRPLSVGIEYTPLVNQTQAQSMINAYLTTDTSADVPKSDVDMKNSTTSHFGSEWFAAYRRRVHFRVPPLKQNNYETGSGDVNGNADFENSCSVIVKPTGYPTGDNAPASVGEVYMIVKVAFSSPATPIAVTSIRKTYSWPWDQPADVTSHIFTSTVMGLASPNNTSAYLYINSAKMNDETAVPLFLPAAGDIASHYTIVTKEPMSYSECQNMLKCAFDGAGGSEKFDNSTSTIPVYLASKISPTNKNYCTVDYIADAEGKGKWVKSMVPVSTFNVNVLNPIVTANSSTIYNPLYQFLQKLKATSVPIHNQNVEGETDILDAQVLNNVQIHNKNVSDDTDDMNVAVTNNVQTHNKFVENDTDVAIVHVDNDSDSPVHTVIDDQPIKVEQDGSDSEAILKLLEEIAIFL